MASQEIVAVSQQSVQVVVAQKENAHPSVSKRLAAQQPRRKFRKPKAKPVASTMTEQNGSEVQVTVTETETKKYKTPRQTKKQKKAEREAAATAATTASAATAATAGSAEATTTAKTAKVSVPPAIIQITETIKSQTEKSLFARDEVTVPSAASGGVPEPTEAYLHSASLPPFRLASPRRILIVMDLNGTLLHRPNKRRPSHFVERPHARVFMDYLLSTFRVAVWSSARPQNVHSMVASLLTPDQRRLCLVIWGRDRFGLSKADYDTRVQCYKRLTRLWADRAVASSSDGGTGTGRWGARWDQSNTVLVDDSAEKARSEPFNLLQIPEYDGPAGETPNVLPQVHDYINELAHQADISRYIRENPFKLEAGYTL